MSVVAFLQEFTSACDACGIHKGTATWLIKQVLTVSAEAAVKVQVKLTKYADFYHDGALKSYFAIVQSLLKRYIMDDNIARLNADVRSLRQQLMTPAEYAQEL